MSANGRLPWFAVQVKPRWEKEVSRSLNWKGCPALLPFYTRESRWSDRNKRVELPLFPGYLFASFDPRRPLAIRATPGVVSVVSFGKRLVPLAQSEVEAIEAAMKTDMQRDPCPWPNSGDAVRVVAGPLRGVEGVVSSTDEKRLILRVTLLQRAMSVAIQPEWIEFINPKPRSHDGVVQNLLPWERQAAPSGTSKDL